MEIILLFLSLALANEHKSGGCYDREVEIRANNSLVPHVVRDFCCGICEKKGCTPCGQEDPDFIHFCAETAPASFVAFDHDTGCYANCICIDLNASHNYWVTILSIFGASLILLKFVSYFSHKTQKLYAARTDRKNAQSVKTYASKWQTKSKSNAEETKRLHVSPSSTGEITYLPTIEESEKSFPPSLTVG